MWLVGDPTRVHVALAGKYFASRHRSRHVEGERAEGEQRPCYGLASNRQPKQQQNKHNQGVAGPQVACSLVLYAPLWPITMEHEPTRGVEHHQNDFYSSENPIPSIQRFFNKGIGAIVARGGRSLSDDEAHSSEESDSSNTDGEKDDEDGRTATAPKASSSESKRASSRHTRTESGGTIRSKLARKKHKRSRSDTPDAKQDNDDNDPAEEDTRAPEERAQEKQKQQGQRRGGARRGKAMKVYDPITQQTIQIRDVRKKDYLREMSKEEARRTGRPYSDADPPRNVTTGLFPPSEPLPARVWNIHPALVPIWIAWSAVLLYYTGVLAGLALVTVNGWLAWYAFHRVHAGVEDRRWEQEARRGEEATQGLLASKSGKDDIDQDEGVKEGAEWLNKIVKSLWHIIDPAIFDSMAGTLEDVMQASAPHFIHSIKVSEVSHGLTPLRITGLKVLPDREAEHVVPSDGNDDGKNDNQSSSKRTLSGQHVNLELSVIYHASGTGPDIASRRRNARLMMQFWLGVRKVATVPFPVVVDIKGFVGTVRMRLQLTPEAPFIKNTTVTFLGLPRVAVEVIPLRVNLANIPVLSGFVQSSIDAAFSEYCAPSSLTLDVGDILMGDNIKREVNALGVIVVWIHCAYDLEKQDRTGLSDPYVTVSYSRLGKVTYATRVAMADLSPRWEERHVMLLSPEAVRAKEKISIALWDSDRLTADDVLGRVEHDLAPLICNPGKVFKRSDSLMGISNQHSKKGQLQWSVAFFRKVSNRVDDTRKYQEGSGAKEDIKLQRQADQQRSSFENKGKSDSDEMPVKDKADDVEESTATQAVAEPTKHTETTDGDDEHSDDYLHLDGKDTSPGALLRMLDAAESSEQTRKQQSSVEFYPPDPGHPSGILSMQVHNITNLEFSDDGSTNKTKTGVGTAAQSIDDKDDENESPDAPSSYVSIILNDQTVMISRIKALSNAPFFNIGTERFVRDWRRCIIMIVVRDRRLREVDPILGVVPIKLSELFGENGTSQVTQYFPLAGGIGRGSVRISLLFRPVEGMHLSKEKLGFDIGTMRIHSSPIAVDLQDNTLRATSVRMRTLAGHVRISSRNAHHSSSDKSIEWRVSPSRLFMRIPARRRYAAPLVIEFRRPNALGVKTVVAASIIWMQDCPDDEMIDAELPIYKGNPSLHRYLQNYHDYAKEEEALELGVTRVGTLRVTLQFKSGIGPVHAKLDGNPDSKAVMEAWQACVSAGLRSSTGDFTNKDRKDDSDGEGGEDEERSEGESDPAEDTAGADKDVDDASEDEDEGEGESDDNSSFADKWKKWRAEQKEMHRQHRGVQSHKAARTASWLVSSARTGGTKVKRRLTVQDRVRQQVDSEL